jgi:S-methylmethionine-dependent homocysteine/selenocysteine methylase
MTFIETVTHSKVILAEGAVIERLNRDPAIQLDPHILSAGLIYDEAGSTILSNIYRDYIEIGSRYELPIIVSAPTWRANPERIGASAIRSHQHVNQDCVAFMEIIRKGYAKYSQNIFIAGLMACRGDAYRPEEALSAEEAKIFHRVQAQALAETAVDLIMAATLPAASEAHGMAQALSEFDLPYILSFVIRPDGSILDGTPLHRAIAEIDAATEPKPFFYMVNCVHPTVFEKGIGQEASISQNVIERIMGFQANTSAKRPEELDGLSYLDTAAPLEFAQSIVSLNKRFGIKILGGCCGTDNRHIEEIAKQIE